MFDYMTQYSNLQHKAKFNYTTQSLIYLCSNIQALRFMALTKRKQHLTTRKQHSLEFHKA